MADKAVAAVVAAAVNKVYTRASVLDSVRHLLDCLEPRLANIVRPGDRVFVKVNMGCSGSRDPESRLTSHPLFVEAIIKALLDCGAKVSFGDDVARAGKYCESIYQRTGMRDVATHTGAQLVDFVTTGAREVRGRLFVPRKYLVTNAYFEADRVVNIANCRSHQGIGLSGAMKNMFGCVVGLRKLLIHNLFPGQPKAFGQVIADIYGTVRPDVSFLDLTTVAEGAGINIEIRPVGLLLGSTDAVALDTVAAHTIGYDQLPLWITYFGGKFGLGSNSLDEIGIRGVDWSTVDKPRLKLPWMPSLKAPFYDRATALINNTWMRPRPMIAADLCSGCGDCVDRCPVKCIAPASASRPYRIDLVNCVDCGCCLKVCEEQAVNLTFVGIPRMLRRLANRLPERVEPPVPNALDPAAPNLRSAGASTPIVGKELG